MRWVTFLVLWVMAIVLAVIVVRRLRRGKPVVLAGRWSPRLVRTIVVVLIVVGFGDEGTTPQALAAPDKPKTILEEDKLPEALKPATVQAWLNEHQVGNRYTVGRRVIAQALAAKELDGPHHESARAHAARLPEALRKVVLADMQASADKKALPPGDDKNLLAVLDELEANGRFDHFWNAYLWRKTATEFTDAKQRIELLSRLRRHARITNSLIRAFAQVKPVMQAPRAWASKGGGDRFEVGALQAQHAALVDVVKVAGEIMPRIDDGTWSRDGVVLLKPLAAPPTLIQGGKELTMPLNESTRFGRLDLLKTGDKPSTVELDWLGAVKLPANKYISVWELPTLMPDEAKKTIDATVALALLTNSEEAADRLERYLAVTHRAIRAGVNELPNAKGAPRLRLILSLFDDTVMPVLSAPAGSGSVESGGLGQANGLSARDVRGGRR